jgi:hypothetical protein
LAWRIEFEHGRIFYGTSSENPVEQWQQILFFVENRAHKTLWNSGSQIFQFPDHPDIMADQSTDHHEKLMFYAIIRTGKNITSAKYAVLYFGLCI